MIRYLNEDLDLNTIVTGQHFISQVIDRIASIDTIDRHDEGRKSLRKMTSSPNARLDGESLAKSSNHTTGEIRSTE